MNNGRKGKDVIYSIRIEEFCAIDNNFKTRYFLKETFPDVHNDISNMDYQAAMIEEINGIYPQTYVNNTRNYILNEKNNLPCVIPVKIIKKYDDYNYLCKDLFCNKKFIIPVTLLSVTLDSIASFGLDLFIDNFSDSKIKSNLTSFHADIYCKNKFKPFVKGKKKDTK